MPGSSPTKPWPEDEHASAATEYTISQYTRRGLFWKLIFGFPAVQMENDQSELPYLLDQSGMKSEKGCVAD